MGKSILGKYIEQIDVRNSDEALGEDSVIGISTQKSFIFTKADLSGVSLTSYKKVPKNCFVYVPDTSRRGDKMALAYNKSEKVYLVSAIYTVFRVKEDSNNSILPEYLFLYFNRPEFDRYSRFHSWGSAREVFSWEDMCDIDIDLPPVPIQQKYVDVYNALLANQRVYEKGLDDLKLTCDAYIERLRREMIHTAIGKHIKRYEARNADNKIKNVQGISVYKKFRDPTSKVNTNELSNYKIVKPRQIGFVQTTNNEKVFAYAFNDTKDDIVISSVNEVLATDEDYLLPEYLSMFFNRTEFDRYARFHSWGSARETFTWNDLIEVKIPIPNIEVQKSIVNIYNAYTTRQNINEKLKQQLKNICPILIKGSVKEGARI